MKNTKRMFWIMIGIFSVVTAAMAQPNQYLTAEEALAGDEWKEISGELDVIIVESFDEESFEFHHYIREKTGKAIRLEFDQPPGKLKSGKKIKVRGYLKNKKKLKVKDMAILPESESGETDPYAVSDQTLVEERNAVVILVDLVDAKASSRYSVSQVTSHMYTGTKNVRELYEVSSLGVLTFPEDTDGNGQADVFGPFTIPHYSSSCDYYNWAYAAESAATDAGVDLSLYKHRVFVLPRYNELSCSWAGIANVGCGSYCRAWIAEGESPMVYAHELGHNLNMAHAGTDPENDGTTNSAYGDYADPMGLSRSWHIFNAAHVDQMGWFEAYQGSVINVVSSGTYDIYPLSWDPQVTDGAQILKIHKPDTNEYYYVSYRRPHNYDASLSATYTAGANIHRYQGSGYSYTNFLRSSALTDGQSFSDSNNISIMQVAHASDNSYVTVSVDFGGGTSCNGAQPSLSISPSSKTVEMNDGAGFTVVLLNNDANGCSPTLFSLQTQVPSGVSRSLSPSSLMLNPGEQGTAMLTLTSGIAGDYAFSVTVSDNDGNEPEHSFVTDSGNLHVNAAQTCSPAVPGISLSPASVTAVPGESVDFQATISNNDNSACDITDFHVSLDLPAGLTGEVVYPSVIVSPGHSTSVPIYIYALSDGVFNVGVIVDDIDGYAPDHSAVHASAQLMADDTPPSAPANLTVESSRKHNTLTWEASVDQGVGVDYYEVYRDEGNGMIQIETSLGTSYKDSVGRNSPVYSYAVKAVDKSGHISLFSNTATAQQSSGGPGKGKGKKNARIK